MKEELRNIENYPDYYVSDMGNVYSTRVNRRRNPNGKLYKLSLWDKHPSGYINAGLYNQPGIKNKTYFRLHRLVWQTFKGEIPEGMDVDHINNDKKDNRLSNLQLLTRKQNIIKYHKIDKLKK